LKPQKLQEGILERIYERECSIAYPMVACGDQDLKGDGMAPEL